MTRYPVLLPLESDAPPHAYPHLRLHNGTIWRWNRMLIGFDSGGAPHLRIEQRVMPAGPSIVDMIANAAFYYGVVRRLASAGGSRPKRRCPSPARARISTRRRATGSMRVSCGWTAATAPSPICSNTNCCRWPAKASPNSIIARDDIERYLDVIAARLRTRRNGAAWQLAHHAQHRDFFRLTADYLEHQRSGMPVHEWPA